MATAERTLLLGQCQHTFATRVPWNPPTPLCVENRGLVLQMQRKGYGSRKIPHWRKIWPPLQSQYSLLHFADGNSYLDAADNAK